jgi:hypothetical protein
MYSFNQINNKENIILICVSISDKKIWVIPNNAVNHLPKINISQRSKYNAYLVHDNNVLDTYINKYADEYYTTDLTKYTTPVAALQQREQQYVKKREEYVNFLEYIYPDIQHTATDFIVNDKKVQEKVVSIYEKKLSLQLAANNGRKDDGSRNFRTYRLGENDFYWCHSPIDDRFWIIPESILFQRGYISDSDVTLNRKAAYITKLTKWIKPYEFNYKNVNKERIISIFAGEVPEEIPEEVPEEVPDKTDNYNCKKVGKYDNDGNLLGTYNSISEAAKINNISRSTISAVCRGVPHYNTAAGFIWKYIAST